MFLGTISLFEFCSVSKDPPPSENKGPEITLGGVLLGGGKISRDVPWDNLRRSLARRLKYKECYLYFIRRGLCNEKSVHSLRA